MLGLGRRRRAVPAHLAACHRLPLFLAPRGGNGADFQIIDCSFETRMLCFFRD